MSEESFPRIASTFLALVKISSPTGEEAQLSDYLLKYFKEKKIDVFQDTSKNVFVKIPGSGEPLFICAHMDTVEPGREVKPVVAGDIITSSGDTILGADNKSTIAVILELIERLQEKDISHRPLEILFTVDEEVTSKGAINFDYLLLSAKKGIISDISMPLGVIVLGSPAYARFDAVVKGEAGHAAYPEKATNVLDATADILKMKKGRLDQNTTLNIGLISSGTARNTIPGQAIINGEIRSYDQKTLEGYLEKTVSFIRETAKQHGVEVEVEYKQDNPGYMFSEDNPYVLEVASVLKGCGLIVSYIKSPSVSDANEFNSRGLQVVNIGDGTEKTHTVDESVKISDMEKLTSILLAFATKK